MQIYKITNKVNNKIYIGKSVSGASKRWNQHLCQLNDNTILHLAMKKYGIENFQFEIIEDNILDKKILSEREKFWIKELNSLKPNGYNMTEGGEGGNGTRAKNLQEWRIENSDQVHQNYQRLLQWRENNPEEIKKLRIRYKFGDWITLKIRKLLMKQQENLFCV